MFSLCYLYIFDSSIKSIIYKKTHSSSLLCVYLKSHRGIRLKNEFPKPKRYVRTSVYYSLSLSDSLLVLLLLLLLLLLPERR